MAIKKKKRELREKIKNRIGKLTPKQIDGYSRKIVRQVLSDSNYEKAKALFCYVAKEDEVQTKELILKALKQNKTVFVPKVSKKTGKIIVRQITRYTKDLKKGSYGILEPLSGLKRLTNLKKIDLFVIPGCAFDLTGSRLGRGKGMFDQFLSKNVKPERIVGLAFECQLVKKLPIDAHDIGVGQLVTEKNNILIKRT